MSDRGSAGASASPLWALLGRVVHCRVAMELVLLPVFLLVVVVVVTSLLVVLVVGCILWTSLTWTVACTSAIPICAVGQQVLSLAGGSRSRRRCRYCCCFDDVLCDCLEDHNFSTETLAHHQPMEEACSA